MPPFSLITILIVGASGDLAQTKTYPALFQLWMRMRMMRMPPEQQQQQAPMDRMVGVARTLLSNHQFRQRLRCVNVCVRVRLLDVVESLLSS